MTSSQTSSSIPSPVTTSLDKVRGWVVDSQLTNSQGSSILPSPVVTTLGQIISNQLGDAQQIDMGKIYNKLKEVTAAEKVACLNILLPQMIKSDLSEMGADTVNHVAHVLGEHC